ncbi:MAG: hypothetical protein M9963_12060 [Kiritimatiellae bacterium]|nr:hypothetical protein [Kiritimatiellia bacterium]MCO5062705.1 hypothetical protein [Kiritimatiellia bacterium]
MKRILKTLGFGCVAGAVLAMPIGAVADEAEGSSSAEASLDVQVLSAYVWRGQLIGEDAVLQPQFTISKNGFSISWWGNLNLTDEATGHDGEFSEHDITVAYDLACPITGADVQLGIVNYDFPNVTTETSLGNLSLVNDTREAFITYALNDVLLAPTLNLYYDFKEADGFYGSLGISHSISLAETVSLDLAASLGAASDDWGSFYFVEGTKGLTDGSVSASLPIAICSSLTITPAVSYSFLLDDAKDAVKADSSLYFGETDYVVGSIQLSYAF